MVVDAQDVQETVVLAVTRKNKNNVDSKMESTFFITVYLNVF